MGAFLRHPPGSGHSGPHLGAEFPTREEPDTPEYLLRLIFLGFLLAVLIVEVFGKGPVTAHRIRGAIVVYLLLGGVWGLLYHLVALAIPNSFHLPGDLAAGDRWRSSEF